MMSSISAMRPSMKPWRSRAAVYSAFSEMSPCSRAAAIDLMIAGRSTLLRVFSSSARLFSPPAVIGTFSMITIVPNQSNGVNAQRPTAVARRGAIRGP
jgi:hypothetical protein